MGENDIKEIMRSIVIVVAILALIFIGFTVAFAIRIFNNIYIPKSGRSSISLKREQTYAINSMFELYLKKDLSYIETKSLIDTINNVKAVSLNPNSDVMEKSDVISDHVYKAIPESEYEIEGYDISVIKNITIVDITDLKDNVNETNTTNSVNEISYVNETNTMNSVNEIYK